MFSSIANNYDLLNTLLSLNRDKYWRKFAVSKIGLRCGGEVLDVATGTGKLALELARKVGQEGRVTGIDFCARMLSNAQHELRKTRCKNVELIQTNAEALPFADGAFDCATISFGLRNMTDIKQPLQEMTRVIKVGGKLVCLEFSRPSHRILRWIYRLYIFTLPPFLGWLISKKQKCLYLPSTVNRGVLKPPSTKTDYGKSGAKQY